MEKLKLDYGETAEIIHRHLEYRSDMQHSVSILLKQMSCSWFNILILSEMSYLAESMFFAFELWNAIGNDLCLIIFKIMHEKYKRPTDQLQACGPALFFVIPSSCWFEWKFCMPSEYTFGSSKGSHEFKMGLLKAPKWPKSTVPLKVNRMPVPKSLECIWKSHPWFKGLWHICCTYWCSE